MQSSISKRIVFRSLFVATHKRSASRILVSFPAAFPKTTWNARLGRCIYSAAIKAVRAAPAPPPPSLTDRARARGAGKGQCEPSPSPPALHQAGAARTPALAPVLLPAPSWREGLPFCCYRQRSAFLRQLGSSGHFTVHCMSRGGLTSN